MEAQNLKIHIVEDDFTFSKIIELFLKDLGYLNIKKFHSGGSYLKSKAYKDKPDIVLLDYHFKGIVNGDKVLELIKKKSKFSEIIMMSSFFNESKLVKSGQLNAFSAITKDGNFSGKLRAKLHKIQKHIETKKMKRKLSIFIGIFFLTASVLFILQSLIY